MGAQGDYMDNASNNEIAQILLVHQLLYFLKLNSGNFEFNYPSSRENGITGIGKEPVTLLKLEKKSSNSSEALTKTAL